MWKCRFVVVLLLLLSVLYFTFKTKVLKIHLSVKPNKTTFSNKGLVSLILRIWNYLENVKMRKYHSETDLSLVLYRNVQCL